MKEKDILEKLLDLHQPWEVCDVALLTDELKVILTVQYIPGPLLPCPVCGEESLIHDYTPGEWRHLDICGFVMIIRAHIPRITCRKHGICQIRVPWAKSSSGYTSQFERFALSWIHGTSVQAVSERLRISWDEASAIKKRADRNNRSKGKDLNGYECAIAGKIYPERREYLTVLDTWTERVVLNVFRNQREKMISQWFERDKGFLYNLTGQYRIPRGMHRNEVNDIFTVVNSSLYPFDIKVRVLPFTGKERVLEKNSLLTCCDSNERNPYLCEVGRRAD